jgi:hypothetical protein
MSTNELKNDHHESLKEKLGNAEVKEKNLTLIILVYYR